MSNPTRYNIKPGAEGYEIAVSLGGEWVRWTDYRASSFVTAVPVEQYERVVKAGDAMADALSPFRVKPFPGPYLCDLQKGWNAAKEGKPSV